jgi:hypothetical protein
MTRIIVPYAPPTACFAGKGLQSQRSKAIVPHRGLGNQPLAGQGDFPLSAVTRGNLRKIPLPSGLTDTRLSHIRV